MMMRQHCASDTECFMFANHVHFLLENARKLLKRIDLRNEVLGNSTSFYNVTMETICEYSDLQIGTEILKDDPRVLD